MFRKRIVLFKIDTTGLDGDGAMRVVEHLNKQTKQSWWSKLWNEYIFLPTYAGDTSNVMVVK